MEKTLQSKIIMDGLLEVFEDGSIYKINGEKKKLLKGSRAGRNSQYCVVAPHIDGVQKHFLAHRLVAEAFLPNPDNKAIVSHKDGNLQNNCVDNLEWSTQKEIAKFTIPKMIETRTVPCKLCGVNTINKDRICPECRAKEKAKMLESIKEEKEKIKREELQERFGSVDISRLTVLEVETVRMRAQGLTLDEIATTLNCTKQCIDQRLRNVLRKGAEPVKRNKTDLKREITLRTRLEHKKIMLQELDAQKDLLIWEIGDIEKRLQGFEKAGAITDAQQTTSPPAATGQARKHN